MSYFFQLKKKRLIGVLVKANIILNGPYNIFIDYINHKSKEMRKFTES